MCRHFSLNLNSAFRLLIPVMPFLELGPPLDPPEFIILGTAAKQRSLTQGPETVRTSTIPANCFVPAAAAQICVPLPAKVRSRCHIICLPCSNPTSWTAFTVHSMCMQCGGPCSATCLDRERKT